MHQARRVSKRRSDEHVGVELVAAVVVLDQSQVTLELAFQAAKLLGRRHKARGVLQVVDDRPTDHADGHAGGQRFQGDVPDPAMVGAACCDALIRPATVGEK